MMMSVLDHSNGLQQQLIGASLPEMVVAAAIAVGAVVIVVTWRARTRAADRMRAAARAYAERELARQNQLNTSGCPA